jgi:hypothetical protein
MSVFVGAEEPVGVVSAKRYPQALISFAIPPPVFTHAASALPRVSISATGTVYPFGTFAPGADPVVGFTYSLARVNPASMAATSLVPEPIAVADVMYGASAFTAATVVSSLMMMKGVACNAVQEPSADISSRLLFVTPGLGCPPVDVMYTSVALAQEYWPVSVKFPFASVEVVSSVVAIDPSPPVPTVYSTTVEYATGCWPPCTRPLSVVDCGCGERKLRCAPQPARSTATIDTSIANKRRLSIETVPHFSEIRSRKQAHTWWYLRLLHLD